MNNRFPIKAVLWPFGSNGPFFKISFLILLIVIVGSCKKDLLLSPEVPNGALLNKAKDYYSNNAGNQNRSTEQRTLNTNANNDPARRTPLWADAKMERTSEGKIIMTVPFKKYKLANKDLDYVRKYVFEEKNGEIVGGKIVEIFSSPSYISDHEEQLIAKYQDRQIKGLNGSVISYDLQYGYIEGKHYKDGVLDRHKVRISAKQPTQAKTQTQSTGNRSNGLQTQATITCTVWYLETTYYDENGNVASVEDEVIGMTCVDDDTGQPVPPGGGGVINDNRNGDFGVDPNCKNCQIADDKFGVFLEYSRSAGMTVGQPYRTVLTHNGVQYNGIMTQIFNRNGELVVGFFRPDSNSDLFQVGYSYSIGRGNPDNNGTPGTGPNNLFGNPFSNPSSPFYGQPPASYTPSKVEILANTLQLNAREKLFLIERSDIELAVESYLNNNGRIADSFEFAKWALEYLVDNPDFNYQTFFAASEFDGLDFPPPTIVEENLIENGITIEEIPDNTPQNKNKIIGSAPKRHGNNPEDLTYGTNGNTSGIYQSMIGKTDQQLFNSMRGLLWKCSFLSPDLRTVGSQMADRFENNIGGIFESALLTSKVKASRQYQNFLKRFAEDLGKELTKKNGDIDNVPEIPTNIYRPKFNGLWNKFSGLQILINDTESHEIRLINFSTHGGVLWTADIEVTIYDNFGLDKNDALTYQSKQSGFAAWWLLQHTRGFKPFQTKVVIRSRINGRY